jgi:hypothetical protein
MLERSPGGCERHSQNSACPRTPKCVPVHVCTHTHTCHTCKRPRLPTASPQSSPWCVFLFHHFPPLFPSSSCPRVWTPHQPQQGLMGTVLHLSRAPPPTWSSGFCHAPLRAVSCHWLRQLESWAWPGVLPEWCLGPEDMFQEIQAARCLTAWPQSHTVSPWSELP